MADNKTIEEPDFDQIRKEAGDATANAAQTLWYATNEIDSQRRVGVRQAKETDSPKSLSVAPSGDQDNFDSQGAGIIEFTAGSGFNFSGIRNPVSGRRILLHTTGAGTATIEHNNAGSDAANRIYTDTSANKTIATGESMWLVYLNGGWREVNVDTAAAAGSSGTTDVTFNASQFTALAPMTWTVISANIITYAYIVKNGMMTFALQVGGTSCSGGAAYLKVDIPGGYTATKAMRGVYEYRDNSTVGYGPVSVDVGATTMRFYIAALTNWAASASATAVYVTFTFEVT